MSEEDSCDDWDGWGRKPGPYDARVAKRIHEQLATSTVAPTILRYLLVGGEVWCGGEKYLLSSDHELCVRRKMVSNGVESDVLLKVNFGDLTLADFVSFCGKLTKEEFAMVAASAALSSKV